MAGLLIVLGSHTIGVVECANGVSPCHWSGGKLSGLGGGRAGPPLFVDKQHQ